VKLLIVAVGALRGSAERELCAEYLERLAYYCKVQEIVVKPDSSSREALAIAKACGGASVLLCDERGKAMSSPELARKVATLGSRGKGEVAFVIGGAHGLPPEVDAALGGAASIERWSFSLLTFPHRLARVILSEQLYRAMTILRGEPYHHA
jgi:23S rRNA (pseudouridine1915-N3)-methyltransferase